MEPQNLDLELKKLRKENDTLREDNATLKETIKILGQKLYPSQNDFTKTLLINKESANELV